MPNYELDTYLSITHQLSSSTDRDILGIPFIEKEDFDANKIGYSYGLIKYNNCNKRAKFPKFRIAHGFMSDECLNRYLQKPIEFLLKMGPFAAWATPDVSIDMNATRSQAIGIIERVRWFGRLGQEMGHKVFATVGWSRAELDDICFAGLRDGATFFISTLGVNNKSCSFNFLRGYKKMRSLFPNSKIVCVGNKIEGMDDDVIYISYKESFGSSPYLQLKLFNINELNSRREING